MGSEQEKLFFKTMNRDDFTDKERSAIKNVSDTWYDGGSHKKTCCEHRITNGVWKGRIRAICQELGRTKDTDSEESLLSTTFSERLRALDARTRRRLTGGRLIQRLHRLQCEVSDLK